ncbi:MAG: response regulator [Candidatus Woesearchaeota archaeon]
MRKKIMIVDDEPDVGKTIEVLLEKNGFDTILAYNGDECLDKLKAEKPDLILMDIMMPGTPVKKIVSKIKGIKIAYLSVVNYVEAEKEGLIGKNHVVDYIQKPFNVNDLVSRVKKLVSI